MQSVLAIIPVRRSRPGLPGGVLADLGGRPLLSYTLEAAAEAAAVERVVVAAADPEAAAYARGWGAETVRLPGRFAEETAAAEDVLRHALELLPADARPELVALLSPQLPLRRAGRLDEACAVLRRDGADSLMSVCADSPYVWRPSPGGLIPFYDPQERGAQAGRLAPWLRESGSLYLSARDGLERHGRRLFGRIAVLETDWTEAVRADDAAGLAVCRALLGYVRVAWRPHGDIDEGPPRGALLPAPVVPPRPAGAVIGAT